MLYLAATFARIGSVVLVHRGVRITRWRLHHHDRCTGRQCLIASTAEATVTSGVDVVYHDLAHLGIKELRPGLDRLETTRPPAEVLGVWQECLD